MVVVFARDAGQVGAVGGYILLGVPACEVGAASGAVPYSRLTPVVVGVGFHWLLMLAEGG
jgi:hypothetical protein